MTIARYASLILCTALCACGDSATAPAAADIAAVRAVDEDRPGTTATPTPEATPAAVLASSAMPGAIAPVTTPTAITQQAGQMPQLAVSAMADRPIVMQPASGGASATGSATPTEAIPNYPPRSGITTGRLCAAAVGAIMGRTEMQVGIQYESPGIARVGYQRADNTQWTYDCRFDGAHVTWRTVEDGREGRWRTSPTDEVITYAITPGGATVTVDGKPVRIAG